MEGIEIGQNLFHFKGFEVTRKIVLEGISEELPDMLHELADILVELDLQEGDKITGNIQVTNLLQSNTVKLTTQVVSAPRKPA